jgi:hypothetical protein
MVTASNVSLSGFFSLALHDIERGAINRMASIFQNGRYAVFDDNRGPDFELVVQLTASHVTAEISESLLDITN